MWHTDLQFLLCFIPDAPYSRGYRNTGLQQTLPKESTLTSLHTALCMETETVHIMEGLSSIARGCSGKWRSQHPWKCSRHGWTWHLMLWFNWPGGVRSKIGFDDLGGLFQPWWLYHSMTPSTDSATEFLATATNVVTWLVNIHHNCTQ